MCSSAVAPSSPPKSPTNMRHQPSWLLYNTASSIRRLLGSDGTMSSISAQGVVERASAELSKRINGLGLRSSKHHSSKSSVMERVTNVFCGGGNNQTTATSNHSNPPNAPEKPSRLLSSSSTVRGRAYNNNHQHHQVAMRPRPRLSQMYLTWDQLINDDRFLFKLFMYFSSLERCVLAQVCTRWRDVLYRSPRFWSGLVPAIQCRELRQCQSMERTRLYSSLLRRGFHSLRLMGASDEDAIELVTSFPLASKHVHSLSLRCSSVTDRGLESLLDHLQVRFKIMLITWALRNYSEAHYNHKAM